MKKVLFIMFVFVFSFSSAIYAAKPDHAGQGNTWVEQEHPGKGGSESPNQDGINKPWNADKGKPDKDDKGKPADKGHIKEPRKIEVPPKKERSKENDRFTNYSLEAILTDPELLSSLLASKDFSQIFIVDDDLNSEESGSFTSLSLEEILANPELLSDLLSQKDFKKLFLVEDKGLVVNVHKRLDKIQDEIYRLVEEMNDYYSSVGTEAEKEVDTSKSGGTTVKQPASELENATDDQLAAEPSIMEETGNEPSNEGAEQLTSDTGDNVTVEQPSPDASTGEPKPTSDSESTDESVSHAPELGTEQSSIDQLLPDSDSKLDSFKGKANAILNKLASVSNHVYAISKKLDSNQTATLQTRIDQLIELTQSILDQLNGGGAEPPADGSADGTTDVSTEPPADGGTDGTTE